MLVGYPADVIMGEIGVAAVGIAGGRQKVPWATLNITALCVDGREVPPFRSGMLPGYTPWGRLRVAAAYWLADQVVGRAANACYNALAAQHG